MKLNRAENRLFLVWLCLFLILAGCTSAQARDSTTAVAADNPVALQTLVNEAHSRFKDNTQGANADYIPVLTTVPSELFAVVIMTADGIAYSAGDADYTFSIQSVAKPFNAALILQEQGSQVLLERIGVEPTGLPFNSRLAIELYPARSVNPLVNAGAIAAVSLIEADSEAQRWRKVQDNLSDFAGTPLTLLDDVYQSEYETAFGNRSIANLLFNYERLYSDPEEALRVYTKMCSVGVTTTQLAAMGATLANGGVNPQTGKRLLDAQHVPELLSVMLTAGFYDESGRWSWSAGLPAKTGVGGGIVAVAPGRMAIAAFSPRVNEAGNSVRAMKAIEFISNELNLNLFTPH